MAINADNCHPNLVAITAARDHVSFLVVFLPPLKDKIYSQDEKKTSNFYYSSDKRNQFRGLIPGALTAS